MTKWISCIALLMLTSPTVAGELDLSHVSADAKWLVHIDVDAAQKTTGWEMCEKECSPEKRQAMIDKAQEHLGMDPTKDLHGITLYGTEIKEGQGVMLLNAKLSEEKVAEHLKKKESYKTSEYNGKTLHSITMKHRDHEHEIVAAFVGEDLVVVASPMETAKQAIDLASGKGKSLKGTESPLGLEQREGTVFQMAVTGMDKAPFAKHLPPFLQGAKVTFLMGENDGTAFFTKTINTQDEESAEQLKQVAEGFKAMMQLQTTKNQDATELIKAMKINSDGNSVTVSWEGSAETVLAELKKAAKKHKGWMKHRHKDDHGHKHDHEDKDHPKKDKPKKDHPEKDKSKKDKSEKDKSEKDKSEKDKSEKDKSEKDQPKKDRPRTETKSAPKPNF